MPKFCVSLPDDLSQFIKNKRIALSKFVQDKLREEQLQQKLGEQSALKFMESFRHASAELIAKWEETVTQWNRDHPQKE